MRTLGWLTGIFAFVFFAGCGGGGAVLLPSATTPLISTLPASVAIGEQRTDVPSVPTAPKEKPKPALIISGVTATPITPEPELTDEQVRTLVRQLASIKDAQGQFRLVRWASKNLKILVAPSAAGEIQAIRDGCKLWENENLGFSFNVQLVTVDTRPPGSVTVILQSAGENSDAQRWNQATIGSIAPFTFDTGLIRIKHGSHASTMTHELWHILVSDTNEPSDQPPFTELLAKAATRYIWSHSPGDVI